jgi:hypothetical protein
MYCYAKKHIFSEFEIQKQKINAETRNMGSLYIVTQSKPRRGLEEEGRGGKGFGN